MTFKETNYHAIWKRLWPFFDQNTFACNQKPSVRHCTDKPGPESQTHKTQIPNLKQRHILIATAERTDHLTQNVVAMISSCFVRITAPLSTSSFLNQRPKLEPFCNRLRTSPGSDSIHRSQTLNPKHHFHSRPKKERETSSAKCDLDMWCWKNSKPVVRGFGAWSSRSF